MFIRTRVVAGAAVALTATGGMVAAHTSAHAADRLTFESRLTAIQFFSSTGPIGGFPTAPLAPGDRIIGQDRILQNDQPVGHDNEVCTVSFNRDVLCQGVASFDEQGDLQVSWTLQWPATGTSGPSSFDGVVDGGTGQFETAHGSFRAITLPNGDMQVTARIRTG